MAAILKVRRDDEFLFIIYLVDFEAQKVAESIIKNASFKAKVIEYAKKELDKLKQIDKVIKALLSSEDFLLERDLGVYPIQFLGKIDKLDLELKGISLLVSKDHIEKLIEGYRILYVRECTLFVPILAAPKWVKGLIQEKDFELQLLAPGFTVAEEKFHLEVEDFESTRSTALQALAGGRLLLLYSTFSQLK